MSTDFAQAPKIAFLSELEMAQYQEKGFVIPNFRLPKEMVEIMREALDGLIAKNPTVRPEMLLGVHIKRGYSDGMLGDKAFFDFAIHPPLLDIIEQLIGPDIILWASQIICKPRGDGMEVPWHQDAEYWPIHPLATTTAWIALEDATIENGCMRVIPGSHKSKKHYSHQVSDRTDLVLNQVLDTTEYDSTQAVDIELQAGQISFHDAFLIHGSNPNLSDKRRSGFIVRYMPSLSHYDRGAGKTDQIGHGTAGNVNYANRPIYLVRGEDRCGKNDFKIGHERDH